MSTELKKIIVDLKKRVDNLTNELKQLRSFLSKMNSKKNNPYKWHRYYNRENREKNTKTQIKPDEKKLIEKNNQPHLENEKFTQDKSHYHQKNYESLKSKKPEKIEFNKSSKRK